MTENPFVTLRDVDGQFQIQTNIRPDQRPVMLWMLEQAKMILLTKQPEAPPPMVTPVNGISGLIKRMTK